MLIFLKLLLFLIVVGVVAVVALVVIVTAICGAFVGLIQSILGTDEEKS
jgi:hypothetical protein